MRWGESERDREGERGGERDGGEKGEMRDVQYFFTSNLVHAIGRLIHF